MAISNPVSNPETTKPSLFKAFASNTCSRCGTCLSQCPLYQVILDETSSPRGKISLSDWISDHSKELNQISADIFHQCLLCLACQSSCPNGVKIEETLLAIRKKLARKSHVYQYRFVFQKILGTQTGRLIISTFLSLFAGSFHRNKRFEPGWLLSFIFGHRSHRSLPLPSSPSVNNLFVPPSTPKLPRIFLFSGCLSDFLYLSIGNATASLIRKSGAGLIWPKERLCCGFPLLLAGDEEGARHLARKNLTIISKLSPDLIISPCPSCSRFLKSHLPSLLPEESLSQKISSQVCDLLSFFHHHPGLLNFHKRKSTELVTYHDPCHLSRGLGIQREPRIFLDNLAGDKFIELPGASQCCGFGGTFNLTYNQLSKKILNKKLEAIIKTGARSVATACPGCILQIEEGMHNIGEQIQVKHLFEILNQSS